MLWGQRWRGERKNNPSYVDVFLCQEHQLRGICLQSLVIVDSMLEAIVLWSVTPTETCVHGFNQLEWALAVCFFLFFFKHFSPALKVAWHVVQLLHKCQSWRPLFLCVGMNMCVLAGACVPLSCPSWMMALLKCCEEKHWFAMPLIHCWCERNLHSRQTQDRSGLSLAGWLDTSSLSSGLHFGSSHYALAHNLQARFAEAKKKRKKKKSWTN